MQLRGEALPWQWWGVPRATLRCARLHYLGVGGRKEGWQRGGSLGVIVTNAPIFHVRKLKSGAAGLVPYDCPTVTVGLEPMSPDRRASARACMTGMGDRDEQGRDYG